MPKLYPVLLLLFFGLFSVGIPGASAQCSDFTFTTTVTNVTCNNASNGSIAINVQERLTNTSCHRQAPGAGVV
jgi:hypothetical protein